MRFASLCSGIEAASVAWKALGWEAQFFSEIDKFPCAVLAHHYPDVPNLGDMNRFKDWPDAAFDVLVGGTPCQSFSVAGLRKGLVDPRGNLALVYLAIAARYRPHWLVWENVPGVLSSNGGRDFGAFLGGLGELGYGFAYRVLDAQYVRVDGLERAVPQRRRRVFVVGHLGDWRRAAAVLFERESLSGHPAPRREAREKTTGTASYGISPDCFDRTGEPTSGLAGDRNGLGIDKEVAYSLRAKRPSGVAHAFGGNRQSGALDVATAVNAHGGPHGRLDFESETFIAFSCKDHGADAGETAPTLRAMGHDGSHANAGGQGAIAFDARQSDVIQYGDKTGPLDTDGHTMAVAYDMRGREGGSQFEGPHDTANIRAASGGSSRSYVAQQWAVRRLTPEECESLQGFSRGYTAIPYRGRPAADGPRYKALGNSMAVNCMRWIGRRIQMLEDALAERAAA